MNVTPAQRKLLRRIAEGRRLWRTTRNGRWWTDRLSIVVAEGPPHPGALSNYSTVDAQVAKKLEEKLLIRIYGGDPTSQINMYVLTMDGIKAVPTERKS